MGSSGCVPAKVQTGVVRRWFFSVLVLGTLSEAQSVLFDLITHDSYLLPDAAGCDLWLQRQAIVQLVRPGDAAVLLPYNPAIRPALVYYAALKASRSPWRRWRSQE
jgi:hypothetical protein